MKLIIENFRNFQKIVEEEDKTLPKYVDEEGQEWLDRGRILTSCGTRCQMIQKTPEVMASLRCVANCPEQTASSIRENIPALNQPIDIGKAAATVGGLQLEDGYMFYTIDGKRPRSPVDIEKLAQTGTVLMHHFKPGADINQMTDLVNLAQQSKAIESSMSQRANPTRAFFEAGLVFRMSPDAKNNAVKLVVSKMARPSSREVASDTRVP